MQCRVIVLWMGALPEWMPEFIVKCNHPDNAGLEWLIVTDQHTLYNGGPRVRFRQMDWPQFRRLARDTIGVTPPAEYDDRRRPCDYRPAFGEIFAAELVGMDAWGYCDLDIVPGRLARVYLHLLYEHDIVADGGRWSNGPWTLLRNAERVNRLYRDHDQWRHLLTCREHHSFNEKGFGDVIARANESGTVRAIRTYLHTHDRMRRSRPGILRPSGVMVDKKVGREIPFYHFPRTKRWPSWASVEATKCLCSE